MSCLARQVERDDSFETQVHYVRLEAPTVGSAETEGSSVLDTLQRFLSKITTTDERRAEAKFVLELDVRPLPIVLEPTFLTDLVKVVRSYRASFDAVAELRLWVRPGAQALLTRLGVSAVAFPMPVMVLEDHLSDD